MRTAAVIAEFGSPSAVAAAVNVSRPAVSRWIKRGIVPKMRAYQLEVLTRGRLQVDLKCYQ